MAFQLSWTIEGEKQFSRRLRGLETELKDFTKPLTVIATKLRKTFGEDVFTSKGTAIGESWQPLSPNTLKQKQRRGFPSAPLIATGAMKSGFRAAVSSDQAVLSNTQEYFKYHQSNKPRKRLPRRVMMKLGNQQREMIQKEFQVFIQNAAK